MRPLKVAFTCHRTIDEVYKLVYVHFPSDIRDDQNYDDKIRVIVMSIVDPWFQMRRKCKTFVFTLREVETGTYIRIVRFYDERMNFVDTPLISVDYYTNPKNQPLLMDKKEYRYLAPFIQEVLSE